MASLGGAHAPRVRYPTPNASVAQVLPCYQVLHQLEQQLA